MNNLIVITGGTKGIGRAIAFKFASEGWDVVNCSSNSENLEHFKNEFQTLFPNRSLFAFQADLSKPEQVKNFCKEVVNINRPIQVLVNNAGVFLPGSILEEADGVLEFQLALNVQSAYYVSRAIIPTMVESGKGAVFSICSTASIMPYINGGSYCISKYALLGMTKVLREELKSKGVKVTAVLPGATLTNSWKGTDLPESRFIKPEDIADAIFSTYSLSGNAVVEEILIRPQEGDL
jgi:short-subunit dehydrogenase